MIGFCTDSNAQFPGELVERYRAQVVPLTVTVDGVDYLEGVDLDADSFYARFEAGTPEVATAAPAPARFAAAYEGLAAQGATEILSVHLGSEVSGTFNSARIAAQASPVPVRLVDTGTASFAIACCLWEAAEAVHKGAAIDEAAAVAEAVAGTCGNVFVVGALDLARRGGRLNEARGAGESGESGESRDSGDSIPVLSLTDGRITPVGQATSVDEAATLMAAQVRAGGDGLRVGIGVADRRGEPFWLALERALADAPEVIDVVRYRVGPSVGVHTGPGTAGAVFYRALSR